MFFGKKFSGYQKKTLSGLEILVLSIIKNKDGITGYEIIQNINEKFNDLWKASAGTIYPLLNRLAKKDLILTKEMVDENNRQKKIYRISTTGNEELRRVLEENLEVSINTLGDFIRTIFKASIPSERTFESMIHCFPFHKIVEDIDIDENDYSLSNIKRVESIISRLGTVKEHFSQRIKEADEKIEKYKTILEKVKKNRQSSAKEIKILDDNDEFEDF
ncbi:MAG: hypothetical protein GF353_11605 [Candidatus Lokiarchaeota archaeon]|nr:hypothetical protein [Candidatus Lokiarchaeota archaeon]